MINKIVALVGVILIVLAAPAKCESDSSSGGPKPKFTFEDKRKATVHNNGPKHSVIVYYGKKKATIKAGQHSDPHRHVTKVCTDWGTYSLTIYGFKQDNIEPGKCRKLNKGEPVILFTN